MSKKDKRIKRNRRIRRRKPFNYRIYLIIFFFIPLVIIGVIVSINIKNNLGSSIGRWLKVREININPFFNKALNENIEKLTEDKFIISLDIQNIREKILESYPELKDVKIYKKFPYTLEIEIEKRVPFFQIKSYAYYIVDKDLIIIDAEKKPAEDLIVVEIKNIKGKLRKGTVINDERVRESSRLVEALGDLPDFPAQTILAHDLDNFSFICGRTKIILGKGDLEKKLKIFSFLLKNEFDNDLSSIRYVDLRYSKVYISRR